MNAQAPILLAEDEETDVFWFGRALGKAQITRPLASVPDGRAALRYLLGEDPFADRSQHPLPALIVLDLKMPIVDGFDVLRWLQTRDELKEVPAVVLTSSDKPADRANALALGARGYYVKPANPADLLPILQEMAGQWLPSG